MPNLHGERPDGQTFAGVSVKLGHGVAISWDGQVICNRPSLSQPNEPDGGGRVGSGRNSFKNHLHGAFTAAIERVLQVGRLLCSAALKLLPLMGSSHLCLGGRGHTAARGRLGRENEVYNWMIVLSGVSVRNSN